MSYKEAKQAQEGLVYKGKAMSAHQAVLKVVRVLRESGYEALLAGGCVRDKLLGEVPKDYDVATNAVPAEVGRLFDRTLTVGTQFGVVVVLLGGRQIEVATFRSDMSYSDGRRPEKVVFTDARHDSERRDFTINGMFYDPLADKVIDYVGGQEDLRKGIVRAIGNADERFAEDHLRMLRAVRFACRLDFEIEGKTWQAICKHAAKIERISAERIAGELEKIMVDPHRVKGVELAMECGLLEKIVCSVGINQLQVGIKVMGQLPKDCSFAVAMSSLLAECGEKKAGQICRKLKTSNEVRRQVQWLVGQHGKLLEAIPLGKGQLKRWLAEPLFEPLVQLARCYLRAMGRDEGKLRQLRRQIRDLGDEPITPKRLLDGHELKRLGAPLGPMMGQLTEELYLAQLENEIKNETEARRWVMGWLARHKAAPNS